MAQIKNLTPHPIHLLDEEGNVIRTFDSEGLVRLKTTTVDADFTVDGCRVTKTVFGEPEGLPKLTTCMGGIDFHEHSVYCGCDEWGNYNPHIYYIVSQLVKSALPGREDLLVPAEVVRDEKGNIIGCKSFGI